MLTVIYRCMGWLRLRLLSSWLLFVSSVNVTLCMSQSCIVLPQGRRGTIHSTSPTGALPESFICPGGSRASPEDRTNSCPRYGSCAVNKHNVETAMSVSPCADQHVDSFRRIAEAKLSTSPHRVNVIVIGGSMTAGQEINCDCKCSNIYDARCPPQDKICVEEASCSWKAKLFRWLTSARGLHICELCFYAWTEECVLRVD